MSFPAFNRFLVRLLLRDSSERLAFEPATPLFGGFYFPGFP